MSASIPPLMDVRFHATVMVVFTFPTRHEERPHIEAAYGRIFELLLKEVDPFLSLVHSYKAGDDFQGPGRVLKGAGIADVYEATIAGPVRVPVGTPPATVVEAARERVEMAMPFLPGIHLVGQHIGVSVTVVRLAGKRDCDPHRAFFGFDEAYENPERWFPGFSYGDEWNGWAKPLFEADVAKRVAETYNSPTLVLTWNEEAKTFTGVHGEEPDEPFTIEPEILLLPGEHESRLVYDFSLGMCWLEQHFDKGLGVGVDDEMDPALLAKVQREAGEEPA